MARESPVRRATGCFNRDHYRHPFHIFLSAFHFVSLSQLEFSTVKGTQLLQLRANSLKLFVSKSCFESFYIFLNNNNKQSLEIIISMWPILWLFGVSSFFLLEKMSGFYSVCVGRRRRDEDVVFGIFKSVLIKIKCMQRPCGYCHGFFQARFMSLLIIKLRQRSYNQIC